MLNSSGSDHRVELLAPAGNWAMLNAAVQSGADAVYFGLKGFNMRSTARNFGYEELGKIADSCHTHDVRAYLALNTIIYEEELCLVNDLLRSARDSGVDAVICWDHSIILEAVRLGLETHISTQASISNSEAAEYYHKLGASRCVLARECTLEHIQRIKEKTDIGIEVFAHGAMCISVSGRCQLSQFLYGRSANRGDCLQPCRRAYDTFLIKDQEEKTELEIGNDYILSPKDLCTLPFLDKLIPVVDVLKIEGRARSPEYVATVTGVYREAVEAVHEERFTEEFVESRMNRLKQVYNRGFSSGFYLGKPVNEFTQKSGSQAEKRKMVLGTVTNYYRQIGVAEVLVRANELHLGDEILIIGPTTGVVQERVTSMEKEHRPVQSAGRNERVGVKLCQRVRKNDEVFLWQ